MRLSCRLVSAIAGTTLAILLSTSWAAASLQANGPDSIRPVAVAHPGTETYKRLYDFGVGKRDFGQGKRASYVAEYKRLPMYNFGIGKRAGQAGSHPMWTVGAAPPGMYAFGIGKRGDEQADLDSELDISQTDLDDPTLYDLTKRAKMYSFGIGKRGRPQYAFGLGKRTPMDTESRLEEILLGNDVDADELLDLNDGMEAMKRRPSQQYAFGLGKRRPGRYDFGLGKRSPTTEAE